MVVTIGGFMATGKSTVGRKLADRLGWPFFDLDTMVEQRCVQKYGVGITALIERGDEALFRLQERELVVDGVSTFDGPTIVSLGGGTLHNGTLGQWLEQNTILIVLRARWNTVQQRIADSHRPLKAVAMELFVQRQQGYNTGYQVVVDSKDVKEVVDILESYVRRSHR